MTGDPTIGSSARQACKTFSSDRILHMKNATISAASYIFNKHLSYVIS